MNFAISTSLKSAVAAAALLVGLSSSREAHAEVTLVKTDNWEVFTTGRVNAFFSYGWGDTNPPDGHKVTLPGLGLVTEQIPAGGGLITGVDSIPKIGPDGMPINGQGTFRSMRVRSGFVPDVFGLGLRWQLNDTTVLKTYFAIWGTIESEGLRKSSIVYADAREAYLQVDSPRWGTVTAGRALDLFSRGATENDFMYGHGYGLGFPGNIDNTGPTAGMIGFGVLAAFFSPGIVYTTPSLAGLRLAVGVYDPTTLPGYYESTRDLRPEGELTYDFKGGPVKLHLFANGGYQNFYKSGSNASTNAYGAGYGGRIEVGPAHLGVAGHYGKGLGLQYAFQANDVNVSPNSELRTFDGYSVLGQYVLGHFDLNAGWGVSRTYELDSDKVITPAMTYITLPEQWAFSAGVVYHATDNLHLDIDYLHGVATWKILTFQVESQTMDFINTGVTATW
jgi:predicted porin